jgi:hypothetical protein
LHNANNIAPPRCSCRVAGSVVEDIYRGLPIRTAGYGVAVAHFDGRQTMI